MKKAVCLIAALLIFSFAVSAQDADLNLDTGVKKHKGIDEIYKDFSEAYRTLKPDMVANLYTDDAAYLVPGNEVTIGRDKVLENFTNFFNSMKTGGQNMTISFRIIQRQVGKKLAYDVGVYTLRYYKEGKMQGESKGKFVVVASKGSDKKWRFQVDGYSGINPPKSE